MTHAEEELISRACDGFSRAERIVVMLRFCENLSLRATGVAMGLDPATVGVIERSAIEKVRRLVCGPRLRVPPDHDDDDPDRPPPAAHAALGPDETRRAA